ncbi:MAG TPA: hypothetical protein VFB21_12640 [Chthonomonadaceae bacterium]|nr:hypothetical protein [Chthonomonadaceae bacterium]
MQRRIGIVVGLAISLVAPALLALCVVLLERTFTEWTQGREAILPLATLLLLSALLHPRLRRLLIVTLCYGVAFLALRDALHAQRLPPAMDYDIIEEARPAALILVAGLAGFAAVAETLRPGTVWARRCYFGAAALYFTGIGIINYGWHKSWQSLMLCATGMIALFGCLFAQRIVADEIEAETEETVNDEALQREREAAHRRVLRAKEWHDTRGDLAESPGERESASGNPPSAPTTAPH